MREYVQCVRKRGGKLFLIFIAAAFTVLELMSLYCSFKYRRTLQNYGCQTASFLLPILFSLLLVISFVSFTSNILFYINPKAEEALTYFSAVYICFVLYSFMLFIFADILSVVGGIINFSAPLYTICRRIYANGLSVLIVSLALPIFGVLGASHLAVTEYDIAIDKPASVSSLHAVMVSDIHVGPFIGESELAVLKQKIAALSPDVVFVCGDIVDHGSSWKLLRLSLEMLGGIKTKYGTYFVTGNHELYLDEFPKMLPMFAKYNVKVIDDTALDLGGFIVAGRGDGGHKGERIPLAEILSSSDRSKAVILLDHRPRDIEEARAGGVDLEFSGHTHRGQIFPLNIIASLFNEALYGHVKKGDYNLIVSSGVGVWNEFPVRIGSIGEIVSVRIKFGRGL